MVGLDWGCYPLLVFSFVAVCGYICLMFVVCLRVGLPVNVLFGYF